MLIFDFIVALCIGLLMAAVFAAGFGRRGPWASFWIFFLVVFLAAWAGGAWLTPLGPPLWGVYWVPFLFVGLLFALLLAAASPPPPPPGDVRVEERERVREDSAAAVVLEMFFWVWVVFLLVLILGRYFFFV